MTNIKNSSGQRGVALLFALGILSLLLVMGVAFLGNALISQKIAVNSQESASSKLLGQSAIDHVLSHLTMFHLAQARLAGDFYASDASSVFSRRTTGALNSVNSLSIARDQIYTSNAPLLTINRGKQGNKSWYDGSKSLAEWVYVHEDGKFSDGSATGSGKITGRFAYQVLPQTSSSRLSLYAVTAGASRRAGYDLGNAATARIPQKHRWGLDIDELVPSDATMFKKYWHHESGDDLCDPLHEFDNFVNVLAGKETGANYFLYNNAEAENRKRFLEHIFSEGRGRLAREAYWGGSGKWYPRFNLGRFTHYWNGSARVPVNITGDDNWYQRFLDVETPPANAAAETALIDAIKNKSDVVDLLLDKNSDTPGTKEKYTDSFLYDGQYAVFGLPFLRRIGNDGEKGAFSEVQYLRRQVAANLNDYCDADSIPTSDVPASEWGNRIEGVAPKYTGNEKTPYINEIAFGFKLDNASVDPDTTKCVIKSGLKGEMLAELIGVYKGLPESTLKLHGKLTSLSLKLKLSVAGKATYKADDKEQSVTFTESDPLVSETTVPFNALAAGELITEFKRDGNYWVGKKDLALTTAGDLIFDLTEAVKAKFIAGVVTDTKIEVEKVKFEVLEVKFNLGHLALHDSAPGTFVDFVNVDAGDRTLTPEDSEGNIFSGTDGWVAAGSIDDETAAGKGIFYAGSMSAIDPRQNLHAKITTAAEEAKKNDWYTVYVPTLGKKTDSGIKWDDISTRLAGEVNLYSKPNAPKYADGGDIHADDRDAETTDTPDYRAAAGAGTAEKMISTAVIRNAPMMSPWELGFIHRGIPFQTINLLKAGGIGNNGTSVSQTALDENAHDPVNFSTLTGETGTSYKNGDAGILDQIKMTDLTKSYGKVDFSALQDQPANWVSEGISFETLRKEIFASLFNNLKSHAPVNFVEQVKDLDKAPTFSAGMEKASITSEDTWFEDTLSTVLRSRIFGDNPTFYAKFKELTTDAEREEVIGKVINLIEGRGASLPTVFKVVIVAQAIRDLDGEITKLNSVGTAQTKNCSLGVFDATILGKSGGTDSDEDSSIYYDEILGSTRMLVTIEKLHYFDNGTPRAKLRVKQVEYLD